MRNIEIEPESFHKNSSGFTSYDKPDAMKFRIRCLFVTFALSSELSATKDQDEQLDEHMQSFAAKLHEREV